MAICDSMFLRAKATIAKKTGKESSATSASYGQTIAPLRTKRASEPSLSRRDNASTTSGMAQDVVRVDNTARVMRNLSFVSLERREIPADVVDAYQVKLSWSRAAHPRLFGSCWLACELWQQLAFA